MAGNDLVGKPRDDRQEQPYGRPVRERKEGELVEMVMQAAQEIESTWLPVRPKDRPAPAPGDWAAYNPPDGYGRTRIVLLVRDPYWLHCYWEIAAAERENLRAQYGRDYWETQKILRVYDLTGRSIDDRAPDSYYDVPINNDARNWYLETGRPGHTFLVELGVNIPGRGFVALARSNMVSAPTDKVSGVLDEEWMIVEESFRRLYRLAAGLGPGHSSVELMESLARRLALGMGSGAVSSLGSGFRQLVRERQFWLVIGTELIVYGATQPDAAVTIDGMPVCPRPDGTFSARFALPDGERHIPVTGISSDGQDSITITPFVRKETR